MTFPDAATCAQQECGNLANMEGGAYRESYRGFEFSVGKRCSCLFDYDQVPPVQNPAEDPVYVSKMLEADGPAAGASSRPGTTCYARSSGNTVGTSRGFYAVTLLTTAVIYTLS